MLLEPFLGTPTIAPAKRLPGPLSDCPTLPRT